MRPSDELYREVIIEHSKNPKVKELLPVADVQAVGHNPACGDKCCLNIKGRDCIIEDIGIDACGCSISQASASMLSEAVKGKTIDEVEALIEKVKAMLRGDEYDPIEDHEDLEALGGVRQFPMRVKCAMLAWTTLQQALTDLKLKEEHKNEVAET